MGGRHHPGTGVQWHQLAAENDHCNTTGESALILSAAKSLMLDEKKIVDPWEIGSPTQPPPERKVNTVRKGEP